MVAGLACKPAAVEQVLPYGQVRKEPALLEDIADAALVPRHEDPAFRVDEQLAVHADAGTVGPDESGDGVDDRGLPGARLSEQGGEPPGRLEGRVDLKRAEAMNNLDVQAHRRPNRLAACRESISESSSAAMEMAMEMAMSRNAPASPPGTCVKV